MAGKYHQRTFLRSFELSKLFLFLSSSVKSLYTYTYITFLHRGLWASKLFLPSTFKKSIFYVQTFDTWRTKTGIILESSKGNVFFAISWTDVSLRFHYSLIQDADPLKVPTQISLRRSLKRAQHVIDVHMCNALVAPDYHTKSIMAQAGKDKVEIIQEQKCNSKFYSKK